MEKLKETNNSPLIYLAIIRTLKGPIRWNFSKPFKERFYLVRNKHNFCSLICRFVWQRESGYMCGKNNPSWQGGLDCRYRGSNWDQQREKALERDYYTCQRCGLLKRLELRVHHKKPYQLFDSYMEANDLSNLVTLCKNCHGILEHQYIRLHPESIQLRRIPKTPPTPKKCLKCDKIFQPERHKIKACTNCMTIKCPNCEKDHQVREFHMTKFQVFCSSKCVSEYFRKHDRWPVRKVTQIMIQKMKMLRDKEISYATIAEQIGLSKYAVRTNLVNKYGDAVIFPTTHIDRNLFKQMQDLSNYGFSTRKIATKMGIGKSTVARHLKIMKQAAPDNRNTAISVD